MVRPPDPGRAAGAAPPRVSARWLAGAAGFLTVYNNVFNLVPRPWWAYVPVNLAVGAALVAVHRRRGWRWSDLGMNRESFRPGLRWGGAAAAVVGGGLLVALAVPALRPLLEDQRMAGVGFADLLYRTMVRIPLGTAFFEELVFRGVLFSVWAARHGTVPAVLGSSAVFGLWHIVPTLELMTVNDPGGSVLAHTLGVAGGVALTAVAGVGFCLLRIRTGGVWAPTLVHWAINSLASFAAYAAVRGG